MVLAPKPPVSVAVLALLLASAAARAGGLSAAEVSAALDALAGADLVELEDPAAHPPRVRLHTRVAASTSQVRALLASPPALRDALPALRRVAVVARPAGGGPGRAPLLIEWELEVPLWNLEGRLWLRPTERGADLQLTEGALAPGVFRLAATPDRAGETLLTIDAQANLRDANWMTRRIARRHALAEPAMTVATDYVFLRALRLEAERPAGQPHPQRTPHAGMWASAPDGPGAALGRLAADRSGVLAAVRSRADGRLDIVSVAVPSRVRPEAALALVAQGATWRALPGWRDVVSGASRPEACAPNPSSCWRVDGSLPFVDLDATWKIRARPFFARAVTGDVTGAVMGWSLEDGASQGPRGAVLSLHPRLDLAGYVPRKLIAAEPLLEHGLSLGLGFVYALSLARTLEAQAGKQ